MPSSNPRYTPTPIFNIRNASWMSGALRRNTRNGKPTLLSQLLWSCLEVFVDDLLFLSVDAIFHIHTQLLFKRISVSVRTFILS